MKKIVLILDGMADRGQGILGGKTPLEYADTPNLDALYSSALAGTVKTIPDGEEAGSAVANLNMLGYTSSEIYKGRAVIEAAGAGLPVKGDCLYIRTNFVTLSGPSFRESAIESYSAHDIETDKARPLAMRLQEELFGEGFELVNTDTFRNILIIKDKTGDYKKLSFMPPHDIIGRKVSDFMDGNDTYKAYMTLLEKAYDVLKKDNDTKANAIWFWGASVPPNTENAKTDDKKLILSETTLMRGIANLLGIECISIPERISFESFLHDKLKAAESALHGDSDFIYIHIQEPDDLSHELLPKEKAEALGFIDKIFVSGLVKKLDRLDEDWSLTVASDHYTFSDTGGHGRQPSPFMLVKKEGSLHSDGKFSENACNAREYTLTPKQLHEKM